MPNNRDSHAADALTAAQRKAAQRARDRARLWTPGAAIDTMPTTALLEALPRLIADDKPGTLAAVLQEIGRRGGLQVQAKPLLLGGRSRVNDS